jgi:O-antigen/teichoic acid export membrane protein
MRALTTRLLPPQGERADITGAIISGYAQMGVTVLVNLLLVPIYLQALGRTGFGLLMMLIGLNAYASIGVLWLFGGLNRRLGVTFAHGQQKEFADAWAAGKWATLAGAIAIGVLVGGLLYAVPALFGAEAQQVPNFPLTLALFFLQLGASWLYGIDRLALTVSGHQTVANILLILQQILLGGVVYLALSLDGGLAGVMAAFLASHLVTLVASAFARRLCLPAVSWRSPFDSRVGSEFRAMLSRQGTAFQIFGVLTLSLQADILIVGLLGGPAIAAEFALVWKIAEVIVQALWRIPDVVQPTILRLDARDQSNALKDLLRRVEWVLLPLAAMAAIGYALLGRWIVQLWVGADHAPADPWVYVLAGSAIFWLTLARIPISAGYVTGRLRGLLRVMGLELLGKAVITAITIGGWGLLAPLVAINTVHALGVAYGYRRELRQITNRERPYENG